MKMMLRTRREMTRGTLMEEDSLTTGWLTGAPRSPSCRTSPLCPLSFGRRKASEVQHLASRPSMARNFRSLVGWLGLLLSPGKPPSDQIWPCLVFPCWLSGWLADFHKINKKLPETNNVRSSLETNHLIRERVYIENTRN